MKPSESIRSEAAASPLYQRIGAEAGLRRLLTAFYADIRQHSVLGPIFNSRIADWPGHIGNVSDFWARQTGGPSAYGGGFARAHLSLGIGPEHPRNLEGWTRIVAPEFREDMRAYVRGIIERHERFDLDYPIVRASDGATRWVHGQGEIHHDAEGLPVALVGIPSFIAWAKVYRVAASWENTWEVPRSKSL